MRRNLIKILPLVATTTLVLTLLPPTTTELEKVEEVKPITVDTIGVNELLNNSYKLYNQNSDNIEVTKSSNEVVKVTKSNEVKKEVKKELKSKQEVKPKVKTTETTTFRVTAYCACEKCCGKWANKRPLDKNGKPIVYGASGEELVNNYSCASPLPFGTKVELDGIGTVEVHDRTADWVVDKHGTNIIDIYMTDHDSAYDFGLQYVEGVVIND